MYTTKLTSLITFFKRGCRDRPEGRLRGEGESLTQDQPGGAPVPARMSPGPGRKGPWSAHCFIQHQLSHTLNFWKLGHPAVFHLEPLSDGRAKLNLTFCLPPPSEIIPPPPPSFPTSTFTPSRPGPHYPKRPVPPTFPPKRPIIPLFSQAEVPRAEGPRQTPALSSKQRKSRHRAVLHRATQATPSLPPTLPGTKPNPPLPPRKRPRRSSSLPSSPSNLRLRLREDFSLPKSDDESPVSSPGQETLRGAFPLNSSLSLSLDHASLLRRDALFSPLNLDFPVEEPKDSGETEEEESSDVEEEEKSRD